MIVYHVWQNVISASWRAGTFLLNMGVSDTYSNFDSSISLQQAIDAVKSSWVWNDHIMSGIALENFDGHIVMSEEKSAADIAQEYNERVCCCSGL